MKKLFTKVASGIVGIALAVGVGVLANGQRAAKQVKAVEVVDTICDFTAKTDGSNSYAAAWTYASKYEVFGGHNNNADWAYAAFGAKRASGESQKVTNAYIKTVNSAIAGDITSVAFTVTADKKQNGTVDVTLEVASDAAFNTVIDTVNLGVIDQKTVATHRITPSSGTSWGTGKYYKLNLTCTNTSTTNGMISLSNVSFNKETSAVSPTSISCNPQSVDVVGTLDLADAVTFAPANTTEKGLTFAIADGAEYIDLTAAGVVTGVKSGSASVTITPEDTSAGAEAINVSITINAIAAPGITVGMQYVVYVNDPTNGNFELTGVDSNLGTAASFTGDVPNCSYVLTAEAGYYENTIAFSDSNGKYLSLTANSNNLYLTNDNNYQSSWMVTWDSDSNAAVITSAAFPTRTLQFNYPTNGAPRFACYSSEQKPICLYVYDEKELESFSLPANITIYVNESKAIPVTYVPADAADKQLTWYSLNPYIVDVDQDGVVTGISVGDDLVAAEKTINGVLVTQYCQVYVVDNSASHTGNYDDPFNIEDAVYVAKGIFTKDSEGNPIDLNNPYYVIGQITATVNRTTSTLTFWLGDDPSQTNATSGGFEVYKAGYVYGVALGTAYATDADVVGDFNVGNNIIVFSTLTEHNGTPETSQGVANIVYNNYMEARFFAWDFIDTVGNTCDSTGNTNIENLVTAWGTVQGSFDNLLEDAAALLTNAEASTASNATLIQQCVALYDYVAGKYNTQLGAEYDFLNRNPAPIASGAYSKFDSNSRISNNTLIIVISVIAAVSALSIGVLLVIKKRKHN